MATNSEGRQATCRTAASTTGTYNEDWLSYCDGSGTFNEQMLAKINAYLGVTYLTLPEAMTALGRSIGPNSTATQDEWGTFTAS